MLDFLGWFGGKGPFSQVEHMLIPKNHGLDPPTKRGLDLFFAGFVWVSKPPVLKTQFLGMMN